ncbi:ATP-binding cassette domain-containing protein [Asaia platycodi]|uniref:ATP-binding cassette domain-containing protein n=1 Tax=Asaia platycodi TaxID=610243 RepID=UPI000A6174B7|nr:ATP-binding cassette domain-containing protein [Asaia platycodi]
MSDFLHHPETRPADLPAGAPPLLTLSGIAKYFPGVVANKDVSIDFYPGEIHALLGENGAGKSTDEYRDGSLPTGRGRVDP